MYKSLTLNKRQLSMLSKRQRQAGSYMAKGGENYLEIPQLLDPKFALKIRNYYITADGGMNKRKGLARLFDVPGANPITMLEKWTDDIYLYGYSKTLSAYIISTDTHTIIKNNFIQTGLDGEKYGDYFFVASPGDKIGRVSQILNYDFQTGDFTTGQIARGTTSGATGIILEDHDSGATGYLTLGNIQGTFINNEALVDPLGGSAITNGVVDFNYEVLANAPSAKCIKAIGPRLYAGNLSTDITAVMYSELDDGSNPPFDGWTVNTQADGGGLENYRRAGAVNDIENLGDTVMIFAENGKWAFKIDLFDSAGTTRKKDDVLFDRRDFGGARGAIATQKGIFYANRAGLWQIVSIGQSNVPYSEQEAITSKLLGTSYFDDIELTSSDLTYDQKKNTVLLTCAKSSTTNNFVLAYNVDQMAFSEFDWDISRFMIDGAKIFAGSSTYTRVWECFKGYSDDGEDIWTEIFQEYKAGELETRQMLAGEYFQGIFSPSTVLNIDYDIFDVKGNLIQNVLKQNWTANPGYTYKFGWGMIGYGSAWGGISYVDGGDIPITAPVLVESFSGARDMIRNWQRLRIRITGHDKVPHQLNWLKLNIMKQVPIRRRNLQKI